MFTFIIAVLALVGLAAIIFVIYVMVDETMTGPRSREELLVEVEALRTLSELSHTTWKAERAMFCEALKHLRGR